MNFDQYINDKKAFVFGFDDVIYPEKDYLLQVYYLFSEFLEYTEQTSAKEILAFMQNEFQLNGAEYLFAKTAKEFNVPLKYLENFDKLHANARLPLKLLLFQKVLGAMQTIVNSGKQVFLLVGGNPEVQINKIRQVEWNGLETALKIYFTAEFHQDYLLTLEEVIAQHQLQKSDILIIDNKQFINDLTNVICVDYLLVNNL